MGGGWVQITIVYSLPLQYSGWRVGILQYQLVHFFNVYLFHNTAQYFFSTVHQTFFRFGSRLVVENIVLIREYFFTLNRVCQSRVVWIIPLGSEVPSFLSLALLWFIGHRITAVWLSRVHQLMQISAGRLDGALPSLSGPRFDVQICGSDQVWMSSGYSEIVSGILE